MICPVCLSVFCVDDQDEPPGAHPNRKVYCSDGCQKLAKKRRSKKRARRAQFARMAQCERQGKVRYRSRRAAMVDLRVLNSKFGLGLKRAYPCGDHWHLTTQCSDTPVTREEVRARLSQGHDRGTDRQEAMTLRA